MEIRVAGLTNDSIVDGPGLRYTVFTQGCPHHCPGCHNPQSHDFEGGEVRKTEDILTVIGENILLDGLTLSGGEPFMQPEACAALAKGAHEMGLNVWCYTGFTYEALIDGKPEWKHLLENIDVLVDGPFVLELRTLDARFRGSSNQRIIDVPTSLKSKSIVLSAYN